MKAAKFIFAIIYKGPLLTSEKVTWVVLTKSQLLRFKGTFGPKICTVDVKKIESQSYKF